MQSLNGDIKKATSIKYGSFDIDTAVEKPTDRRRMKSLIGLQLLIIGLIIVMLCAFFLVAYPRLKEKTKHRVDPDDEIAISKENIATLYAFDPIGHSFCFRDGGFGEVMKNQTIFNRCSDLEYEHYRNASFTVGVEGGVTGVIVDLGTSESLQKKYRYQEVVGNGQGFASIHRRDSTLFIAQDNPYDHHYQIMDESAALFQPAQIVVSAPIYLGHLYAVRLVDTTKVNSERVIKMVVVGYRPHESVTFRWQLLN